MSSSDSSFALDFSENALLGLSSGGRNPAPIFLVAAPRTGSTFVYQSLLKVFALPYISNLTNDCFPTRPILGLALQRGVKVAINDRNAFGKTEGVFQPSEASGPMNHWFGGGHPSQEVSSRILEGREDHFVATLAACEALYDGTPLLIKNAWNCFRVAYLAKCLPESRFIWLKRDIYEAAASDLEARYLTKKDPYAWNSATPSNVAALRRLPPSAQVVENQYEFNRAIFSALSSHAHGRWSELWYEDFLQTPLDSLATIARFLQRRIVDEVSLPSAAPRERIYELSVREMTDIRAYVDRNRDRLLVCRYGARTFSCN